MDNGGRAPTDGQTTKSQEGKHGRPSRGWRENKDKGGMLACLLGFLRPRTNGRHPPERRGHSLRWHCRTSEHMVANRAIRLQPTGAFTARQLGPYLTHFKSLSVPTAAVRTLGPAD